MTQDAKSWPDKPGFPMNPGKSGWHWLAAMHYDERIGPPCAFFWYSKYQLWTELQDKPGNQPVSRGFCYLGPCLPPEEINELLAALTAILEETGGMGGPFTTARAAIAKATGG
ncbi:MAG: hypothetical protein ACK52I_15125 [Pseudomonadota bacterium]|jgi:hypothetical protein